MQTNTRFPGAPSDRMLKIEGEDFPFLSIGNSEDVIIGEWTIAFGNPFGLFDNNAKPTVTVGVVSNSGVSFKGADNRVYKDMIQTDAAISSGNSGVPLLNAFGEVIGVNTVIYSTGLPFPESELCVRHLQMMQSV